jgi:hypothetical protein
MIYTVKRWDAWSTIASRLSSYGVDPNDVAELNGVYGPNLRAGTQLRIPEGFCNALPAAPGVSIDPRWFDRQSARADHLLRTGYPNAAKQLWERILRHPAETAAGRSALVEHLSTFDDPTIVPLLRMSVENGWDGNADKPATKALCRLDPSFVPPPEPEDDSPKPQDLPPATHVDHGWFNEESDRGLQLWWRGKPQMALDLWESTLRSPNAPATSRSTLIEHLCSLNDPLTVPLLRLCVENGWDGNAGKPATKTLRRLDPTFAPPPDPHDVGATAILEKVETLKALDRTKAEAAQPRSEEPAPAGLPDNSSDLRQKLLEEALEVTRSQVAQAKAIYEEAKAHADETGSEQDRIDAEAALSPVKMYETEVEIAKQKLIDHKAAVGRAKLAKGDAHLEEINKQLDRASEPHSGRLSRLLKWC